MDGGARLNRWSRGLGAADRVGCGEGHVEEGIIMAEIEIQPRRFLMTPKGKRNKKERELDLEFYPRDTGTGCSTKQEVKMRDGQRRG